MDAFSVLHNDRTIVAVSRSMFGQAKRFFDHKNYCEHIYLAL